MSVSERRHRAVHACVLASLSLLGSSGCVEIALRDREPMDYSHPVPTPAPPVTEGAIWPGATSGGSYLYFDQKAHRVGDLVTVLIAEDMRAEAGAKTELESSSSLGASISSDVGLQQLVLTPIRWLLGSLFDDSGAGDDGSTVNVASSSRSNQFDGDGSTSRAGTFTGMMTCRVVEVLPGGILHIRGRRFVVVNHDAQYISLEGLVRREDISVNNTVSSVSLAEARLTYDGLGVVDDKQRPGLLARAFDWLYAF